jgi:hypothetical protein
MKRSLTLAACTAAIAIMTAGPSVAGEITGNGKATAAPEHGASACLYSGLDDPDPDPFDRTQNYGQIVKFLGPDGAAEVAPSPGDACNPTKGFEE